MNNKTIILLLIALILSIIAGCGYYNPYVANSDAQPFSVHRSMWKNQTNELGLEAILYQSLSNWLRKTKIIDLKESLNDAQYQIVGKITMVDHPEIAYGDDNEATELRAQLGVEYSIVDKTNGTTIFDRKKTYTETFHQSSSPTQLQTNKNEAMIQIADDISEEIYLYIINKVLRK